MGNEAIRTKHLKKVYNVGEQKIEAINDINISIDKGKLVALIGTSGCGKSTLLHCLGGLDYPTSGDIYVNGILLNACNDTELAKTRRDEIGFVFQNFSLIEELNVRENIILPILLAKRKVDMGLIDDLTTRLGIADRLDSLPSQLSGGQQQRVAIARALVNNPSVVLCDEPTGNLDKKNSADVIDMIQRIHKLYKKTIIIVTHDMNIASQADYVLKMEDGRILS